jgi:opacity protein-like surface antigen
MAKKILFLMVLATFGVVGAFAQPEFRVSAGFGGYITGDFGGGVEASYAGIKLGHFKTPYFGGGTFVFLDVTFVELSLGFFGAGGEWEDYGYGQGTYKYNASGLGLDIGLLGKYPFAIGDQLSIFPLLGITYRAILSAELDGVEADDPGDLSALWFKFGGGLDYSFTDNIYLRAGILYGFRLENQFEEDMADLLNYAAGGMAKINTLLGHGLEIKVAVGFRF